MPNEFYDKREYTAMHSESGDENMSASTLSEQAKNWCHVWIAACITPQKIGTLEEYEIQPPIKEQSPMICAAAAKRLRTKLDAEETLLEAKKMARLPAP